VNFQVAYQIIEASCRLRQK